ncbi:metalloregulator ArsR/SmtB family transcription factor [Alteromonas flava]|uniref:metalloregulator ArsR/SmtB family transcription factor n=1 Tax=Alteromonas flava TaxID=2048003 RepID=UPI000C284E5E|nr:metalloregulator ArsR/SmtB family transcription factor [Alteromonas flava]
MKPLHLFKALSEPTRLYCVLLIRAVDEACVCDLMSVLDLDQPKISRHLAELRRTGLVMGVRRGKWVYYRLAPSLPEWVGAILAQTVTQVTAEIKPLIQQLALQKSSQRMC